MAKRWLGFAAVWLASGGLTAGGANATWRHNHPGVTARDCLVTRNSVLGLGFLTGPIGVVTVLTAVGFADGISFDASPTPLLETPHA